MIIESILNDIQNRGISVVDFPIPKQVLESIRSEIFEYHNNSSDKFKPAGIGRGAQLQKEIRGDEIHWLSKESLSTSQKVAWDFLENLRSHLNQNLFLGLKDFETHLTIYPANSFYKKHIDQFNDQSGNSKIRKISFIIYLNPNWKESDGGELRIFDSQGSAIMTVQPQFGKAIFFLSEEFPHEVLETKRERVSMTGWFFQ